MSDTLDLAARAKQHVPVDPNLDACWKLVVTGIEVGWLDHEELRDLVEHLLVHRDFGVDELLFAHVGDRLRVSLLDDQATCSPSAMIAALATLSPAPGG
jgi:hypothetical protein